MGSANRRTKLSEQIAEILGTRNTSATGGEGERSRPTVRKSIACGSMMLLAINPGHVGAVGLGNMNLKSRLGQPLEATVPLTLNKGEYLPKNCVQQAPSNQALGAPRDMRVISPERNSPGTYEIRVTTANPLHEPMYELALMVKCPGISLIVRQYVLMLDLPGMPIAPPVSQSTTSPVVTRATSVRNDVLDVAPGTSRRTQLDNVRTLPARADSIPAGSTYRVSHGDTLSTIARRVDGRLPDTIWAVSDRIFSDNPGAFIRNDPNMIKLGSLIRVPDAEVLSAMSPSARRAVAPAAVVREPVLTATRAPVRESVPNRTPASVSRSEPAVARRTPDPVSAPADDRWPVPGSVEAETIATNLQAPPVEAPATETAVDTAPSAYPFVDEPPVEAATIDVTTPVTTPATSAVATEPEAKSNWLLSLLVGLLLGSALALFLFRGRLLEALGVGRKTRPVVARAVQPKTTPYDESLAAQAFDFRGKSDDGQDADSLPISGPLEDTYIVETSVAEPTVQEDVENLRSTVGEQTDEVTPASSEAAEDDDSAELAKLFETGAEDLSPTLNEPTAEMPRELREPLEPTAEMPMADMPTAELPTAELPTAELPQQEDETFFDPTAEVPQSALEDIFDPTGGIDAAAAGEIESTLQQAFDEDLENLDPDEMFATANHTVEELAGEENVDPADATINDPLEDPMARDAVAPSDLSELPDSDDNLSESLHEALALLERDYEDEFTASQILERSALEKSLQEELERDADEPDDNSKRKIS